MHEITAKMGKDNYGYYFRPTNFNDQFLCEKKLKNGNIFRIKVTEGRSLKSLGYYWLLMNAISYYRQDGSEQYFHNLFKKMYFGYKQVLNPFTCEIDQEIQSVAFDKIDEIEFKKYLNFIVEKLNELGLGDQELINNYKKYGG